MVLDRRLVVGLVDPQPISEFHTQDHLWQLVATVEAAPGALRLDQLEDHASAVLLESSHWNEWYDDGRLQTCFQWGLWFSSAFGARLGSRRRRSFQPPKLLGARKSDKPSFHELSPRVTIKPVFEGKEMRERSGRYALSPCGIWEFNGTGRRIEGMATNNPGTKTRSFQQVVEIFGADDPVIQILGWIAPQLCLKSARSAVDFPNQRLAIRTVQR